MVLGNGMEACFKFEWKGKESGFCFKDEILELSRPDLLVLYARFSYGDC